MAYQTEKEMLDVFIAKVFNVDPDLLIAHSLCSGIFELLLTRISMLRIAHWSRIGRFKRNQMPTRRTDAMGVSYGGSNWVPRIVSVGRLLVDTFLSCKELIRETSYTLTHLAQV